MLYLVFFLFLFLVFFFTTIFTSTVFVVEYTMQGRDDFFLFKFKALGGIVRLEYVIPLLDLDKTGIQFKKKKERTLKSKNGKDDRIDKKITDLVKKIGYLRKAYKLNSTVICKIKDYLKPRIILEEYTLEAEIGTGDVFSTAFINGLAWTAAGIITSFFLNNFKNRKKCIRINNNYEEVRLDIVFRCIFRTRFVHIIIVVFMFLAGIKSLDEIKRSIGGDSVG